MAQASIEQIFAHMSICIDAVETRVFRATHAMMCCPVEWKKPNFFLLSQLLLSIMAATDLRA
jgi:hypothetical protein